MACGSTSRHPTLPPPEFEPPAIEPWDAGSPAASPATIVEPTESNAYDGAVASPGSEADSNPPAATGHTESAPPEPLPEGSGAAVPQKRGGGAAIDASPPDHGAPTDQH